MRWDRSDGVLCCNQRHIALRLTFTSLYQGVAEIARRTAAKEASIVQSLQVHGTIHIPLPLSVKGLNFDESL